MSENQNTTNTSKLLELEVVEPYYNLMTEQAKKLKGTTGQKVESFIHFIRCNYKDPLQVANTMMGQRPAIRINGSKIVYQSAKQIINNAEFQTYIGKKKE